VRRRRRRRRRKKKMKKLINSFLPRYHVLYCNEAKQTC
jgi:hypothetical protein